MVAKILGFRQCRLISTKEVIAYSSYLYSQRIKIKQIILYFKNPFLVLLKVDFLFLVFSMSKMR